MRTWDYYPLDEPRPTPVHVYAPRERSRLERLIARQVVWLLAMYGSEAEEAVDVCPSLDFCDPLTLKVLELHRWSLQDNKGDLVVGQLPPSSAQERNVRLSADQILETRPLPVNIQPGVFRVSIENDYGDMEQSLTVHHPQHAVSPLIYDSWSGEAVADQAQLQELHEAFTLIDRLYRKDRVPANRPPLQPANYPGAVWDSAFNQLVSTSLPEYNPPGN